jgi:hypothetical protein
MKGRKARKTRQTSNEEGIPAPFIVARRDLALWRALNAPLKPLEKFVGKSSLGKPLKTERKSAPKSRER